MQLVPRVLAIALVGAAVVSQMNVVEHLIYYPETHLEATPSNLGMSFEVARFTADDGVKLHGWYVPGRRAETLVWFHGNAGNISHRLDNLRQLHDLVGVNVLIFDYRGYGQSEGVPSEAGLYADARGALAYLRSRGDVDTKHIVYFGRSLGSAVAVDLATSEPPSGLIVETPFTSVRDMASRMLPAPLRTLVPSMFDNLAKIPSIGTPKLFIHGDRDELVPYEQGRRLYDAAQPPKAFFTIRGAGHNDTYIVGSERYFQQIKKFLDGLVAD